MCKLVHMSKMASLFRHATLLTCINHNLFICILVSLLLPRGSLLDSPNVDGNSRRLTREYHLRQGAIRGLIVKPSRNYDLQNIEMFLGIPYAAAPVGHLRFMPPVSAPPWSGIKMATQFAPVCPQTLPPIKKNNPPSLGRQTYRSKLEKFLKKESEDCLHLNIYVPYREKKFKKFPVLVFIHGDSFEYSSGNPYDGRILSAYGNIMVITINYRLGILGFMKPSLTEHVYGNNGLLDQLAALQWIKDNIDDLNGDPNSVTVMGHGTGAASVNYLMLSHISNGLFHRAIVMSGSALSDWALTKDPTQYTLQVAQSLGCNPSSKDMMACLQKKPLSEIKRIQILSRDFETPLGPVVAGSFVPNEPYKTMETFPNLLSRYQLLCGVTELESYHDFGVIELDHGVLENQRDEFINKFTSVVYEGAEKQTLNEILKQYSTSKLDPQRWTVEANRDFILNVFSDARTLAPMIKFANYQSKANRQSFFYVFGHNSVSTEYASLNKSVHGEELPYIFGVPLGGAVTHFHSEYTQKEKLLSEVVMRLWTNFIKIGTPNTQSVNQYYTLDRKSWDQFNVEWPEYNVDHQSYLRLDLHPTISSFYRSNFTNFWLDTLPNKISRYIVDPLFGYVPAPSTNRPKSTPKFTDTIRKIWSSPAAEPPRQNAPAYGRIRPAASPTSRADHDSIYREIQAIKTPPRFLKPHIAEKPKISTSKPVSISTTQSPLPVKTSSATITLIVSLCILFLATNVAIFAAIYIKKKRLRENAGRRQSRAELGNIDVIGQKALKDDKNALKSFKNSCSVIKSMSFDKIRNSSQKIKKTKPETCKTPKSDDSGGFRERFQLRRHLSTSTLDAHSKVRDWITNEVIHRCSPNILTKSNLDLQNNETTLKPFTRSEELLSDSKLKTVKNINNDLKSQTKTNKSNTLKTKTSEKTTSTSALGSHSSINSTKQSVTSIKLSTKSHDSLKSKSNDSVKSKKVSVAVDATPKSRTDSILQQEPIEIQKSIDCTDSLKHSKNDIDEEKTFTSVVSLSIDEHKPLKISHKHSTSDPVTDVNYEKLMKDSVMQITGIQPPVSFRNNVNVTCKDESIQVQPLTAAESLLTIKRRNFPKVLPDLPTSQKRLSLQPSSLQTFRSFTGSIESQSDIRNKVPPLPPPRTTTLERRVAYKHSKPNLSSFDASCMKKIPEQIGRQNYENIDSLSPTTPVLTQSFDSGIKMSDYIDATNQRDLNTYPKIIIASSDIPNSDHKIIITSSPSQSAIPNNGPRVKLPDDFHSHTTGSITSFSSMLSDNEDDDDEDLDDLDDDTLLQELVGGVDLATEMNQIMDSKGPDSIYEKKKQEIVPVKLNAGSFVPKNKEDYVCVSELILPEVSGYEQTAKIKPNFGLNKLQYRSESINRPPEKAIKVVPKKPASLLGKKYKSKKSKFIKIEHSNSGSSNDTETSTGTVINTKE